MLFVLPLFSRLEILVSHFRPNFWLMSWLLRSSKRKFLCKTVVSEICVTSLGKIQMTLWFNPFGAVALNHCCCCWHPSPQKPGSRWYKFICISTGENSGSLELQWEVFASALNTFGDEQGLLLWALRKESDCAFPLEINCPQGHASIQNIQQELSLLFPGIQDTMWFIHEIQTREPKIFLNYLLLK